MTGPSFKILTNVKEPFVAVYEPISDKVSAGLIESVDRVKLDP